MAEKNYNTSLFFLLSHAVLSIVWNVIGLWLLSQGKQALGPTATYAAIVLFLLLSAGYIFFARKNYTQINSRFGVLPQSALQIWTFRSSALSLIGPMEKRSKMKMLTQGKPNLEFVWV